MKSPMERSRTGPKEKKRDGVQPSLDYFPTNYLINSTMGRWSKEPLLSADGWAAGGAPKSFPTWRIGPRSENPSTVHLGPPEAATSGNDDPRASSSCPS